MMFFSHLLLLSAIAGGALQVASAVSISSQCESGLVTIAATPDAECINASGLTGLFLQGTGSSIIGPVDSWLPGFCSAKSCSNTTLATLVTNITSVCGSEITAAFGNISSGQLTSIVQEVFPTVKKIACLRDSSDNNEFCVTQTLTNIQSTTGTLTLDEASSLVNTVIGGGTLGLSQNTTCTSCTKEAYNIANADFSDLFGSEKSAIQNTCGADFTNGSTASGIVETANNATSSSTSNTANSGSPLPVVRALMSTIIASSLTLAVMV